MARNDPSSLPRRCLEQKPFHDVPLPLLDDPRRVVSVASCLALAVTTAALALGAGWLLEPVVSRPYFFPAFVAFLVTAVTAGTGYGILTSGVFAVGHALVHLPPHGSFALGSSRELAAVLGFFVTGSFVSVLGGALRSAYDRLREQNRLLRVAQAQREDLLSALAHDIRSPLSVINNNAAILRRFTGEEPAAAIRQRALLIESSATTIASMLRDLVDAATLESGHVRLERTPTDLAAFAAAVKERLAATLPVDRVRLAVPPDLPAVEIDSPRFERVLVNLLTNALKYSPPESTVSLGATLHQDAIVISVRDEGVGIPAEDLPRIFDKYYRSSDARAQVGLGLGLFIARLLVEAHGGHIRAESTVGRGTTFEISLPVARAGESGLSHQPVP